MSSYDEQVEYARLAVRAVDRNDEHFFGIRTASGSLAGIGLRVPTPGMGTVISAYFDKRNNGGKFAPPKDVDGHCFEAIFGPMIEKFDELINLRVSPKEFL